MVKHLIKITRRLDRSLTSTFFITKIINIIKNSNVISIVVKKYQSIKNYNKIYNK